MQKKIAAKLTESSGYRLDFFNIGGLLVTRTKESWWGLWHHYSWKEMLVRSFIVLNTLGLAALAAYSCTEEKEDCSPGIRGFVGAGIGFLSSHYLAVLPTIQRRNLVKKEINQLSAQIKTDLTSLAELPLASELEPFLKQAVIVLMTTYLHLLNLSPLIKQRGDAARHLTDIKCLLKEFEKKLTILLEGLCDSGPLEAKLLLQEATILWDKPIQELKTLLLPNSEQEMQSSSLRS